VATRPFVQPQTPVKNSKDEVKYDAPENTSRWLSFRDVEIEKDQFERGNLIIKAFNSGASEEEVVATAMMHTLRERKLQFTPPTTAELHKQLTQAHLGIKEPHLLSLIAEYALDSDPIHYPNPAELKRVQHLLKELTHDDATLRSDLAQFNPKRREEIFVPLKLANEKGLYIYPWLSKKSAEFKFTSFSQFVTAGCMFGAGLQAADQIGNTFALIKHNIQFFPGQKIQRIIYNPKAANVYQAMLFSNLLDNYATFARQFSDPKETPSVLYHLPYVDYVLFGVELYLQGRITKNALNYLLKIIFEQKDSYKTQIESIFKKHGVDVTIISPFENLFGHVSLSPEKNIADTILNELNIDLDEKQISELSSEDKKNQVERCVKTCIEQLQTHAHDRLHQQVWRDFVSAHPDVKSLEDLFKIANAIIMGIAAHQQPDYKICSLLPLSEKQIQLSYVEYTKKLATANPKASNHYPAIFNATVSEPLVTYASNTCTNDGLPFYFSECQETVTSLIRDKKLLEHAHRNVFLFASKQPSMAPVPLQRFLPPEETSELTHRRRSSLR
jgi:hypothetical protein